MDPANDRENFKTNAALLGLTVVNVVMSFSSWRF